MEGKKAPKEITISNEFLYDLDDIYQYSHDTFGKNQAEKYEEKIWSLIHNLSTNYTIFPECRYLPTKSKKYRWIILDAHYLIYRITNKEVQLLRIVHTKRSISKIKTSRNIKP